jgi:hypothetical protein
VSLECWIAECFHLCCFCYSRDELTLESSLIPSQVLILYKHSAHRTSINSWHMALFLQQGFLHLLVLCLGFYFCLFIYFAVLGFELRALWLLVGALSLEPPPTPACLGLFAQVDSFLTFRTQLKCCFLPKASLWFYPASSAHSTSPSWLIISLSCFFFFVALISCNIQSRFSFPFKKFPAFHHWTLSFMRVGTFSVMITSVSPVFLRFTEWMKMMN